MNLNMPPVLSLQTNTAISLTLANTGAQYVVFSNTLNVANKGIYLFSFWAKNLQTIDALTLLDSSSNEIIALKITDTGGTGRAFVFEWEGNAIGTAAFTFVANKWNYYSGWVNINSGSEKIILSINNEEIINSDSFTGTSTFPEISTMRALANSSPIGGLLALNQLWAVKSTTLTITNVLAGFKMKVGKYWNNSGLSAIGQAALIQLNTFGKTSGLLYNGATEAQAILVGGVGFSIVTNEDIRL